MLERRRVFLTILSVLIVLYATTRLWRLDDSCLWFDEIFSVHAAEMAWSTILWFSAQDLIHPPLFYVLLKLWIAIVGEGIFSMRLLPVIFSVAALIPLIRLGRELALRSSTILFAIFLLAVNGSFIKYAQLLRMYSLLMMLSMFSIWLFVRYLKREKGIAALIIVNLLMIFSHYYGWLVIATEISALLLYNRQKWREILIVFGILSAGFMPWLIFVFNASRAGSEIRQNIDWIARPGFAEIATYLFDLVEPFYSQVSSAEPQSIYLISLPIMAIFVAAIIAFVLQFRNLVPDEKRSLYQLIIFSLLPIAAAFAASWIFPYSIWGTRHLIIVAGPAALLTSFIIIKLENSGVRVASIALIVVFAGLAFARQASRPAPVYVWCAWESIANEVAAKTDGQPVRIYAFENLVAYHLWFAMRRSDRVEVAAVKGVEGMHEDESYFLPRGFGGVKRAKISDIQEDRAWLVFRTEQPGQDNILRQHLIDEGYKLCPNFPARYGRTEVYSIEIVKPNDPCGR